MYKNLMKVIPVLFLGLLFSFNVTAAHPIHVLKLKNESAIATRPETVVGERNPLECDACMFLANGLNQTIVHNPKVVAFVTADVEQICHIMPSSVQQLCLSAAQQEIPNLLNHLGNFIATEGCSDLGICHNRYS